jgi:hypothetical protein
MRTQAFGAALVSVALAVACDKSDTPSAPTAFEASPTASRVNASADHFSGLASAGRDEEQACTLRSLEGTYGVQRMGHTSQGQLTAVGLAAFDGQGNSVANETISRNGVFSESQLPAPYTVNPDCTGTLTLDGAAFARLMIVNGGSSVLGMSLTPGNTVAIHYERVVDRPGARAAAACTNATLAGSYGFQRMGQTSQGQLTALGIATFDGLGTGAADQTISRNGVFSESQLSGPYNVNPDCTGALTVNGAAFAHLVVVHGGSEVLGMSLTLGNNVAIHYERLVGGPPHGHDGEVDR